MHTTQDVQRRLLALGHDLKVDGKPGVRTTRAIKAFQVASGLAADGLVGPLTAAKLFPDDDMPRRDEGAPLHPASGLAAPWPLQRDCMTFYGSVGMNQTKLQLPFPMRIAWDKKVTVNAITVHKKVHDSAGRAFAKVAETYSDKERKALGIDLFGGSLNVRPMRGGRSYSMHSWGIAIDFDPERNQLKWGRDKARLGKPDAEPFWRIWEDEGWISLGRVRNIDFMHVQAARL